MMIPSPSEVGIELLIVNIVLWLKLVVELIGASVIGIGVVVAAMRFGATKDFSSVRLTLARFLALALEFQLGADILSTAVAPSWEQIGKLGAIVVILTALNYFLMREMQAEHQGRETPAES